VLFLFKQHARCVLLALALNSYRIKLDLQHEMIADMLFTLQSNIRGFSLALMDAKTHASRVKQGVTDAI